MRELSLKNEQRARRLDLAFFRKVGRWVLLESLERTEFEIHVNFLDAAAMEALNRRFLQHSGSTDVITFDYRSDSEASLSGEIFICVDEAVAQSARFRTSWQEEVFRYFIHGLLHLEGFDDRTEPKRRVMKRRENRLVKELRGAFSLSILG